MQSNNMNNTVFAIQNPYFFATTFVFKEHPAFGSVYIGMNSSGQIDEIGRNFENRFHEQIQDIMRLDDCREANDEEKKALNMISDYYFYLH